MLVTIFILSAKCYRPKLTLHKQKVLIFPITMNETMKYRDIQAMASKQLGLKPKSIKTCWIAEVKREKGLTTRRAWNAGMGKGAPPCPPHIKTVLRNIIK